MKEESKDYTNPEVFMKEMNDRKWETVRTNKSITAELLQSDYPYLDMGGGFSKALSSFKRLTAFANPFAIQQGSTPERIGFTPFIGSNWFMPSPLENDVVEGRLGPSHYDPLKDPYFSPPDPSQASVPLETYGNVHIAKEPLPLSCVRPLQKFYRCRMINGDDKCQEEADAFLSSCPNPVLSEMRNDKLMKEKHRQIQLADYYKAIQVSDYNKGRSVADVPLSVHKFQGRRHKLRPDSIWADERYANVTPEEIEAAKAKLGEHEKRVNARLNPKVQEVPHFDSNKQFVKRDDLPVYVK